MKGIAIIDGRLDRCFPTPRGTEDFLEYSLESRMVVYGFVVCWRNGKVNMIKVNISESLHFSYSGGNYENDFLGCIYPSYPNNEEKTEHITVQVFPDKSSFISLCEILIYVKKDGWCLHPPKNCDPNGQLEVSRYQAVLLCNAGFKEKDGRLFYATCRNNTWSYNDLQCIETSCKLPIGNDLSSSEGEWIRDSKTSGTIRTLKCEPGYHIEGMPTTVTCLENGNWTRTTATCIKDNPEKNYNVSAIVAGIVIVIVSLPLAGLIAFLILRKKPTGRNTERNSSQPTFPVVDNATGLDEAENSSDAL